MMRGIDCPRGHRLQAQKDESLFRLARHSDRDHPGLERTDEQTRQRVAADARDA